MELPEKTNQELQREIELLQDQVKKLTNAECEQKKTEEALVQERQLYLDLANAQPAGIYRLRVYAIKSLEEQRWLDSTDVPYKFEFINDRFCEIFKKDKADLETNPGYVIDYVYEPDKESFAKKNVEANLNTTPFLWIGRFLIEGEIIWTHLESLPRKLTNGDTIWTGIFFDITDKKKVEQEIQQKNEELELLNREKDKLFSIIAHDLRGPFSTFMGLTQIMAERLSKLTLDEIQRMVLSMQSSSSNIYILLENLLQWATVQRGLIAFLPIKVSLSASINETNTIILEAAARKHITISNNIQTDIEVFADKNLLHSILRNLVSNAVKFTPIDGKIYISVSRGQHNVVISIKDSGIGISSEAMKNLFQIGLQNNSCGTEGEPSTGLGLILCKEFVEKHGGTIWAESEEGKGSTFSFSLPDIIRK